MLSRMSPRYVTCAKTIHRFRLLCFSNNSSFSTNDESKFTKFLESNDKNNSEKLERLKDKIKEMTKDSHIGYQKILMDRLKDNPKPRIFISFNEFMDKETYDDDYFNSDLVIENIKSSVPESMKSRFSYGAEPGAFIKSIFLALICFPYIPKTGIWFENKP